MTELEELEKLKEYLEDYAADEQFLLAQERFLTGKPSQEPTEDDIIEVDEKWEERYYRELNERHNKRLTKKHEAY